MATKAQERKALEQIRQIVESLGDDSYIGKAFEGCFEIAEVDIENDFDLSMKNKFEYVNRLYHEEHERWEGAKRELRKEKERHEEQVAQLEKRAKEAERIANSYIENSERWCAKYQAAEEKADKLAEELRALTAKDVELVREIMRLKAKLYDFMEREEKKNESI